jgi:hypothetical protein
MQLDLGRLARGVGQAPGYEPPAGLFQGVVMALGGGPGVLGPGASSHGPSHHQDPGTPVSLIELTSYYAINRRISRTEY